MGRAFRDLTGYRIARYFFKELFPIYSLKIFFVIDVLNFEITVDL